jgi:hypothetical protein
VQASKRADTLRDHSYRDFDAGDHRYLEWHSNGDLLTIPGRSIGPAVIAPFIAELYQPYNIRGLAYDR